MSTQVHDSGEEFVLKQLFESDVYTLPTSVSVGLYHDGEVSGDTTNGDNLADSDGLSAISTEPSGAAYSRQTASLDSTGFSTSQPGGAGTAWQAASDNTLSFDLSDDGSGDIDAYFVVVNYDPDQDGTSQDVLFFTGNLSSAYTLSNTDSFDLNPGAVGTTLD